MNNSNNININQNWNDNMKNNNHNLNSNKKDLLNNKSKQNENFKNKDKLNNTNEKVKFNNYNLNSNINVNSHELKYNNDNNQGDINNYNPNSNINVNPNDLKYNDNNMEDQFNYNPNSNINMMENDLNYNKKQSFNHYSLNKTNNLNNVQNENYNPYQSNPPYKILHLKEKFLNLNSLYIKQKKNIAEALTGCDLRNNYNVYQGKIKNSKGIQKSKKKGKKLLKIKEVSTIYQRLCLPIDCREMRFNIYNYDKNLEEGKEKCMDFEKPYSYTYLCFNRPNLVVYEVLSSNEENKNIWGRISDPWDCCNYNFVIYDNQDLPIYRLVCECCQCAIWCNGYPCKTCEEALINVYDYNTNKNITTIKKKAKNCLDQAIFDTGIYFIPFIDNMDWKHKCLLMCATIFIDYQIFQQNDQDQGTTAF